MPGQGKLEPGDRLVIASHNPGKVREIEILLMPFGVHAVSADTLGLPEPEETGKTFSDNAKLKALAAAQEAGLPALADDSGLEVTALDGAPGIYSARWAGPKKDFRIAMERVQRELQEKRAETNAQRQAHFTCVLCIGWPDGTAQFFEGKVFGHLIWPPRGGRGFGYDPIFVPEGHTNTFGEMDPDLKHSISHRAHAFEKFVKDCFEDKA